jgi:hypothetical protein
MEARITATDNGEIISRTFKLNKEFTSYQGKKNLIIWLAKEDPLPEKDTCILDMRKFKVPYNDEQLVLYFSIKGTFPPLVRQILSNNWYHDNKLEFNTRYELNALAAIFCGNRDVYTGKDRCYYIFEDGNIIIKDSWREAFLYDDDLLCIYRISTQYIPPKYISLIAKYNLKESNYLAEKLHLQNPYKYTFIQNNTFDPRSVGSGYPQLIRIKNLKSYFLFDKIDKLVYRKIFYINIKKSTLRNVSLQDKIRYLYSFDMLYDGNLLPIKIKELSWHIGSRFGTLVKKIESQVGVVSYSLTSEFEELSTAIVRLPTPYMSYSEDNLILEENSTNNTFAINFADGHIPRLPNIRSVILSNRREEKKERNTDNLENKRASISEEEYNPEEDEENSEEDETSAEELFRRVDALEQGNVLGRRLSFSD